MSTSKIPRTTPAVGQDWQTVSIDQDYVSNFFDEQRQRLCHDLLVEPMIMGQSEDILFNAHQSYEERCQNYVKDEVWPLFVEEARRRRGGAMLL